MTTMSERQTSMVQLMAGGFDIDILGQVMQAPDKQISSILNLLDQESFGAVDFEYVECADDRTAEFCANLLGCYDVCEFDSDYEDDDEGDVDVDCVRKDHTSGYLTLESMTERFVEGSLKSWAKRFDQIMLFASEEALELATPKTKRAATILANLAGASMLRVVLWTAATMDTIEECLGFDFQESVFGGASLGSQELDYRLPSSKLAKGSKKKPKIQKSRPGAKPGYSI